MPLCSIWYLWPQEFLPLLCQAQDSWRPAQMPLDSSSFPMCLILLSSCCLI
ncbi:hypothetical protein LINPERPRIM_LOCUS4476 [Linum perenne]